MLFGELLAELTTLLTCHVDQTTRRTASDVDDLRTADPSVVPTDTRA
jgi:hypothetical protein